MEKRYKYVDHINSLFGLITQPFPFHHGTHVGVGYYLPMLNTLTKCSDDWIHSFTNSHSLSFKNIFSIWSNHSAFPVSSFYPTRLGYYLPMLNTLTKCSDNWIHSFTNSHSLSFKHKHNKRTVEIENIKILSCKKLRCRPICQGSAIPRHGKAIQICSLLEPKQ